MAGEDRAGEKQAQKERTLQLLAVLRLSLRDPKRSRVLEEGTFKRSLYVFQRERRCRAPQSIIEAQSQRRHAFRPARSPLSLGRRTSHPQ
jgi:hypothetical protein